MKRILCLISPLIFCVLVLSCGSHIAEIKDAWELTRDITHEHGNSRLLIDSIGKIEFNEILLLGAENETESFEDTLSEAEVESLKNHMENVDIFNLDNMDFRKDGCIDGASSKFSVSTDSGQSNSFSITICGGGVPEDISAFLEAINDLFSKYRPLE